MKNKNIIIIGTGYKNELFEKIITESKAYNLVGTIADSSNKDEIEKYNIIGKTADVKKIVKDKNVNILVIVLEKPFESKFLENILDLKLEGTKIYDFLYFYEKITGKVPVKAINEEWFLFSQGFNILHNNLNQKLKRIVDIIFTALIFIPAAPIMLIAAVIVKLESEGPAFFVQERVGLRNKPFKIYKFRSMKLHDENNYSKYASDKDDRITKFGNFMRKTRIDELPQLFNVLKGDMSFVGPRAEWTKLGYSYMEKIPFYNFRHTLKPGLTGWAQVNYPYGVSIEDAFEKLQYDLYYVKHYSIVLDMAIFLKTIKTVLFGRGT